MPPRDPELEDSMLRWRYFYKKVKEGNKESIDLVLRALNFSENLKDALPLFIEEDEVSSLDIFDCFMDYYAHSGRERGKETWNFHGDLVRYLRRLRDNEPLYLLSEEEQKIGYGFVEALKTSPLEGRLCSLMLF